MYYDKQTDRIYDDESAMEGILGNIKNGVSKFIKNRMNKKKKQEEEPAFSITREEYENVVLPLLTEDFKKMISLSEEFFSKFNKQESARFKKAVELQSSINSNDDVYVIANFNLWDYTPNARSYTETEESDEYGIIHASTALYHLLKNTNRKSTKYFNIENEGDWDTWAIYLSPNFKIEG